MDGADTCSLFCAWMEQLLQEVHEHRRAQGYLEARTPAHASNIYPQGLGSRLLAITGSKILKSQDIVAAQSKYTRVLTYQNF